MTDEAKKELGTADILRILELLPHRYPFLLVDKIIEMNGDESCIGIKNVTFNEPQFNGHFPGRPVMPGVMLIEGMAQTAGTLCIRALPGQTKPSVVYFLTIGKAKFRKPVLPGDVLEYHMNRTARRKNMWWYRGEAKVGGELVAEAELLAARLAADTPALSGIGYREALLYRRGEIDEQKAIALSAGRSWEYARRQSTWFRSEPITATIHADPNRSVRHVANELLDHVHTIMSRRSG